MTEKFLRARRPEQKRQRREAIIAAARDLASRSGVGNVSLGNVADAVGIAKSNVTRYFRTREEIYLELTRLELQAWADEVEGPLSSARGADQVADVITASLRTRPLFCDLVLQSIVSLPDNASYDAVRTQKLAMLDSVDRIRTAMLTACPELTETEAVEVSLVALGVAAMENQGEAKDRKFAHHAAADPATAAALEVLHLDLRPLVAALIRGLTAGRSAPMSTEPGE